jgi:hypothetical protein
LPHSHSSSRIQPATHTFLPVLPLLRFTIATMFVPTRHILRAVGHLRPELVQARNRLEDLVLVSRTPLSDSCFESDRQAAKRRGHACANSQSACCESSCAPLCQPHQPRPAVHALCETHAFAPPRQPSSELQHRPCRRVHARVEPQRLLLELVEGVLVCHHLAAVLAAIPTDFVNAAQSAACASADTGALATGLALSTCPWIAAVRRLSAAPCR